MTGSRQLKGIAASIGVSVAPAWVVGRGFAEGSFERIEDSAVPTELARFEEAVAKSRAEIELAKQELTQRHGSTYAPILDVYLLMHGDALLIDAIAEAIRNDGISAEWAVARVTERLREPLLRDTSSYFRERARDIDHLKEHLLRQLRGEGRARPRSGEPVVVVARDLTPADAVHLLAPPTVGLVTELGAGSTHTAILARTFGVPAVVGAGSGALDIERITAFIESQLRMVPRMCQKLASVPGIGQPVWVDDADFDIDYHVRHYSLPKPGTLDQLKSLIGIMMSQQLLDRSYVVSILKQMRNTSSPCHMATHKTMQNFFYCNLFASGKSFDPYLTI